MSAASQRGQSDSRQDFSGVFLSMLDDQIKRALMANEPFSLVFAKLETYEDLRYAIGEAGLATADIILRDAFNQIVGPSGWFCSADDQGTSAIVLPAMRPVEAAVTAERVRRVAAARSALVEETGYLVKQVEFCFGVGEYQGQSGRDFTTDVQNALYKSMVSSAYKVALEHPKLQKMFLARLRAMDQNPDKAIPSVRKRIDEIVNFFRNDSLIIAIQLRSISSADHSLLDDRVLMDDLSRSVSPVYGYESQFVPARNGLAMVFCSVDNEPSEAERDLLVDHIAERVSRHVEKATGRVIETDVQIVDNLIRTRPDNFISPEDFAAKSKADRVRFMLDSLENLDPNAVEVSPGLNARRRATSNVLVGYSSRYRERMETPRDTADYFKADPFSLLVDMACLRKAVALAQGHLMGGVFQQCTVHINLFNLVDPKHREILEIELRNIPPIARRMIDFSIVRTSEAGSVEDVDVQIGFLKSYARRVFFTTSTMADPRFNVFDCSADGVGLFVNASAAGAKMDEQIRRIETLSAQNKNEVPLVLMGLPKKSIDVFLAAATPEFFTVQPEETRLPSIAL